MIMITPCTPIDQLQLIFLIKAGYEVNYRLKFVVTSSTGLLLF